mmetsp:Transcript_4538/g.12849  ORF Transcript_4538/g.12849 Transcript_4538/m.12849 type:complete len:290 (-) Transcript_4538:169-1038(-)
MRFVVVASVISSALPSAMSAVPACAVQNKGYQDAAVPLVNGGIEIADPSTCQMSCANMVGCKVFTYYINSGGCWLQGMSGTTPNLTDINGTWSGPSVCPALSLLASNASNVTAANATGNATNATAVIGQQAEKSGFPVWVMIVAALVTLIIIALLFMMCCRKEERRVKKKKRGVVLDSEAPSPSSSAASPTSVHYRVAPPVYVQVMHHVVRQTPWAHLVPARQTLFDQIDVNHDGEITREEFEEWRRRQSLFDQIDVNHDGQVTREEFEAWKRRTAAQTATPAEPLVGR